MKAGLEIRTDTTMRLAALISGGKDSALALHHAMNDGHQIDFLVTMIPRRDDSWMFHHPNIHLTKLFAEAADIPLVKQETEGLKEEELEDLKHTFAGLKIDGVVSGAIASQYQKRRIERICSELGLKSITPLWMKNPKELLKELVSKEFKAIITSVSALGFDDTWLGRQIDPDTIESLLELERKHGISIIGEGGEYETLILDAPFFRKRIDLVETELLWQDQRGVLLVKRARLTGK